MSALVGNWRPCLKISASLATECACSSFADTSTKHTFIFPAMRKVFKEVIKFAEGEMIEISKGAICADLIFADEHLLICGLRVKKKKSKTFERRWSSNF